MFFVSLILLDYSNSKLIHKIFVATVRKIIHMVRTVLSTCTFTINITVIVYLKMTPGRRAPGYNPISLNKHNQQPTTSKTKEERKAQKIDISR
jgi:hypothetical protein